MFKTLTTLCTIHSKLYDPCSTLGFTTATPATSASHLERLPQELLDKVILEIPLPFRVQSLQSLNRTSKLMHEDCPDALSQYHLFEDESQSRRLLSRIDRARQVSSGEFDKVHTLILSSFPSWDVLYSMHLVANHLQLEPLLPEVKTFVMVSSATSELIAMVTESDDTLRLREIERFKYIASLIRPSTACIDFRSGAWEGKSGDVKDQVEKAMEIMLESWADKLHTISFHTPGAVPVSCFGQDTCVRRNLNFYCPPAPRFSHNTTAAIKASLTDKLWNLRWIYAQNYPFHPHPTGVEHCNRSSQGTTLILSVNPAQRAIMESGMVNDALHAVGLSTLQWKFAPPGACEICSTHICPVTTVN